jgi:hypothetical protein
MRSAFRALVKWRAVSGLKRRKRGIGPNGRQGGMRGNVLCIVPSSHLAMKLQGFYRSNMGHNTARRMNNQPGIGDLMVPAIKCLPWSLVSPVGSVANIWNSP